MLQIVEQSIYLYRTDYDLILEFGETTFSGFSKIDQFHACENRTANATICATLIEFMSLNH
ncbi:MAG: hypothetical protein ACI8XO_001808 [Verrucomicrobiales bacterium]